MLIRDHVERFLRDRKRQRSHSTWRFYRDRLKRFVETYGDREYSSLTKGELLDYLSDAAEGAKPSTQRHNIVALLQLQKYIVERGDLAEPILTDVKKPPVAKRERLPTEEETKSLLKHASPEFRLIYAALLQTGARPAELCGATFADLAHDGRAIVLSRHKTAEKTGDRTIAIGTKFARILRQATAGRSEGPLFLSPTGKPWTVANLSKTYRRLRDRAGLPKHLCLYLARHQHATELCKKLDIHAAAMALGHRDLKTTQRYVKTDLQQLLNNQDAFDATDAILPLPEPEVEPPAAA